MVLPDAKSLRSLWRPGTPAQEPTTQPQHPHTVELGEETSGSTSQATRSPKSYIEQPRLPRTQADVGCLELESRGFLNRPGSSGASTIPRPVDPVAMFCIVFCSVWNK